MNAAEDSWHGKHVLVTGGSGFIGSNLIRHLAVRGALCTSVDLVEPGPGLPVDRAVLADITDQAAMRRCVAGADVVFPLAGRSGAVDSMSRAEEDLRLNCTAQLVLLENVRAVNPDARIVFPGSRLEYGEAVALPIDEDHRIRPSSPYALHKYSAGQYHLMYHRHFGLRTTVLRLSNPFGPHPAGEGPRYYSVLNRFIDIAINDGTITLFGDGSQVRDYLHIDDVCRAFICAAESDEAIGLVVNVGSGCPTSMSEAARVIVDAVGHGRVEHVAWPADYAEVETGDSYFCIDRAQSVLGWNPMISFEEGIRLCVESV